MEEQAAPGKNRHSGSSHQNLASSFHSPQDPSSSVQHAQSADLDLEGHTGNPSKTALRRKRRREAGLLSQTKKQRLTEGRVRRATDHTIHTDVELGTLKPGLNLNGKKKRVYSREELENEGLRVIPWDGMYVLSHLLAVTCGELPLVEVTF